MRQALVLSALLLTTGLAGCLGTTDDTTTGTDGTDLVDERSPKVFDVLPVEVAWIESPLDGKRMHNAVYRPDTDEPVPVFINFSPYWGDSATERGDNFARYLIDEYVPRGYAVVLSAVRGTGHSEGCFQIGGDVELQDTHAVIDHFANAAWSNGNVAAGGKSYDSTTQNGVVAKVPHPALKGIFHVSGITDMYRYNYRQGVPYTYGALFNTYYFLQGTDEYGASFLSRPTAEGLASEDPESLSRIVDDAACTELPRMQASGLGSGAHGMKDDYWLERAWTGFVGETDWNGSIFFVHGLQDWNVKPDHILPWLENLPDQVRVKGWLHQNTESNGHVYPMRADWNQTMLAWLDHTLKGKKTGLQWTVEAQGSDGAWRVADTWPPSAASVADQGWSLEDQGLPSDDGPPELMLVPSQDEPVRYAGAPTITVRATADHEDPVLTAVLYDEAPNGTRTWTNEAVLRGLYRNGLEQPTPVEPGAEVTVELPFYPQDDVLEPGHAWVVVFGIEPRHAVPTPAQLEGVTYTGVEAVTLPYAPVDTVREPQPEPVPCFAC